jgi:hypothetical protein
MLGRGAWPFGRDTGDLRPGVTPPWLRRMMPSDRLPMLEELTLFVMSSTSSEISHSTPTTSCPARPCELSSGTILISQPQGCASRFAGQGAGEYRDNQFMATEGTPRPYTAASINVVAFDEAVRRRPRMYFGLGQADPRLVVSVVQCAARTPFIWELRAAGGGPVAARVTVEADMRFTLSFDALPPGVEPAGPCAEGGSLIGRPWTLEATAAVSTRTAVKVCRVAGHFPQAPAASARID